MFEKSCRKEKQISKQKKIQTFSRKNKYSCIIYNTRKKKKQATDKPYCLLHNNVIRKFPCFFYFSLPQNHLPSDLRQQLSPLVSPPFGSVGLAEAPRPTLASLRGTDFQSTPTRKKLVGTRRKNRKNLVLRSRNLLLARKQKNRLPQF